MHESGQLRLRFPGDQPERAQITFSFVHPGSDHFHNKIKTAYQLTDSTSYPHDLRPCMIYHHRIENIVPSLAQKLGFYCLFTITSQYPVIKW